MPLFFLVELAFDAMITFSLTKDQINALLHKFLRENIEIKENWQLDRELLAPENLDVQVETLELLDDRVAEALAINDWEYAGLHADRLLAEEGVVVAKGSPDYILLSLGLLAALRKFFAVERERLRVAGRSGDRAAGIQEGIGPPRQKLRVVTGCPRCSWRA